MDLVYKTEKPLFALSILIGTLVWLAIVVGTFGIALVYVLLFLIIYLFVQSGFIAYLRGNTVELSESQFPDLYRLYLDACNRLEIKEIPTAYLMMSDGILNALATRFLRRHYVVLYSSVVEALRSRPEALRFYFGHELAHIKRGHLNLQWLKMPASILPLLGAAYRRAQEYTCDLHGLAASSSRDDALAALAVLGTGGERLAQVNVPQFIDQQRYTGGFWMSYHEFTNDYPWLCKRLAHIAAVSGAQSGSASKYKAPSRSFFAGVLAALTPRMGVAGGGISLLIMVAVFGILAAIAIPAYQDYTSRAHVAAAMPVIDGVSEAAHQYVSEHMAYPDSPSDIGLPERIDDGPVRLIQVTDEGFELTLRSDQAQLDGRTIVVSAYQDDGGISWQCSGGTLEAKYRPESCRAQ